MKRSLIFLLGLALCFGALTLPVWAAEPLPEPTAAAAPAEEAPSDPVQTQGPAENPAPSPYANPKDAAYTSDEARSAALAQWKKSGMRAYYYWSRGGAKQRPAYDRAFRAYYTDDPLIDIVDHLVLLRYQDTDRRGRPWGNPSYHLLDYFDTDEAERAAKELFVPMKINDLPVVLCMDRPWKYASATESSGYSNNTVTRLSFEEGRKRLEPYAFANFTALERVKLADSMEKIDCNAFENCTRLTKVTGGKGLQFVENSAFYACKKLKTFEPMTHLEYISGSAFAGCAFRSLTLDGACAVSARYVYLGAEMPGSFENCKKLKTVTYTGGDRNHYFSIGDDAFRGCTALRKVTLPTDNRGVWLGSEAFSGCTALTTLEPFHRVKAIGYGTFKNCTSLTRFVLPKKCVTFHADMLSGCSNLKKLILKDGNPAGLFSADYDPEKSFTYEATYNFLPYLPKGCTVCVYSEAMRDAVKARGFEGKVKLIGESAA